jgi:predicted outer membrane repeat protein
LAAAFFCLFSLGAVHARGAAAWHVDPSGDDANDGRREYRAFRTLGRALEAARESDIKRISLAGVLPPDHPGDEGFAFIIDDTGDEEITITGRPGANAELRGAPGKTTLLISGGSRVRLENLRVTGGSAAVGGGIYLEAAALTLGEGALVWGNRASEGGGGIYAEDSELTMCGNACIRNNEALSDNAGGVFLSWSLFLMRDDAEITGNAGGGVILLYGAGRMEGNASIWRNQCEYDGAGLAAMAAEFTLAGDARIAGNEAGRHGGGIYFEGGLLRISENAQVIGNRALRGGGVYLDGDETGPGSEPMLDSALMLMKGGEIRDNEAQYGGGVFLREGGVKLSGGRVAGNIAQNGGGLYRSGGTLRITLGVVEANTPNDIPETP